VDEAVPDRRVVADDADANALQASGSHERFGTKGDGVRHFAIMGHGLRATGHGAA
jgi:hypothetical protein